MQAATSSSVTTQMRPMQRLSITPPAELSTMAASGTLMVPLMRSQPEAVASAYIRPATAASSSPDTEPLRPGTSRGRSLSRGVDAQRLDLTSARAGQQPSSPGTPASGSTSARQKRPRALLCCGRGIAGKPRSGFKLFTRMCGPFLAHHPSFDAAAQMHLVLK